MQTIDLIDFPLEDLFQCLYYNCQLCDKVIFLIQIWTLDDFSSFIQSVEGKCYECLFVILYFSGLRIGEAVALKWTDYNGASLFVNKSLSRKAKSGSYEIKEPKSPSSVRKVTLCDSVCDYLNQYKKSEEDKDGFSDSWFIFDGEYPLAENSITRHKDRAIKKAGVRRIRLHDFRHSHASNLIADGMNIVAVSKRLGHKDISITLNTYTHLLEKNNEELIKKLENSSHNLLTKLK